MFCGKCAYCVTSKLVAVKAQANIAYAAARTDATIRRLDASIGARQLELEEELARLLSTEKGPRCPAAVEDARRFLSDCGL